MKQIAAKLAAYILIGAGVTIWCDIANGCIYNADQVAGLTICFALIGIIIHEIVVSIQVRRQPQSPTVNVLSFFEEV